MADDLNTLFDLEIPIKATGLNATRADFRALEQQGTESAARVERALGTMAPPPRVAQGFRAAAVAATDAGSAFQQAADKAISAAQKAAQASQVQFDAIERRTVALQQALRSADTEAQATARLEAAQRQLAKAFQDGNLALSVRARINQELTRIELALSQHRANPTPVAASADTTATAASMERVAASTQHATERTDALLAAQQALPGQFQKIAQAIIAANQGFRDGTLQSDGLAAALSKARAELLELNESLGGVPRSQAEAFRVLLAQTEVQATTTGTKFAALALEVQQATAAYKAGTLALVDYQTAMGQARAQAIALAGNTANLSKGELTAFNGILRQTEVAAKTTARQGLGTMRSSMFALAASMVGTRSTAGTLAGALLQFSIGNTLAVGVAAGILGLVVVYERLTRATHEASEEQDKLLTKLRQVREEREAAEDPSIAFKKSVDAIAAQAKDLQNQLKAEQMELDVALPGEVPVRERHIADLRKQMQALGKDATEALRTFNGAVGEISEKRVNDLVERLNAGKATRAEEVELRAELVKSQAALAGLSDAYRATAQGSERAGQITQRITSIESAFEAQAKKSGKAVTDAAKALTERTQALIALQQLEGPTVERWQVLTDRAATLRSELAAGNLTLDQRVEKLKELRDIEASTGFGDVDKFEKIKTRGPDIARTPGPLMTVQPTAPEIPGGEGSLFGGMVSQITEDGTSVTDAIAEVEGNISAAASEIGASFADALVGGIKSAASGGGIGNAIKGLIGSMMVAVGEMAIKFGLAAIGIATLIKKIMDSLAKLNPIVAIAAGVALVALGTALMSQNAKNSFGGGGGGGAQQPINTTVTVGTSSSAPRTGTASAVRIATASPATSGEAGTATGPATGMAELSLGASVAGASGATGLRSAVGVSANLSRPAIGSPQPATVPLSTVTTSVRTLQPIQQTTFQFTVVGANDPAAQRQIVKMVNAGLARGAA